MDMTIKEQFMLLWNKYFGNTELPIVFYYSVDAHDAEIVKAVAGHRCIMANLA